MASTLEGLDTLVELLVAAFDDVATDGGTARIRRLAAAPGGARAGSYEERCRITVIILHRADNLHQLCFVNAVSVLEFSLTDKVVDYVR
jgi:hypothetical protein